MMVERSLIRNGIEQYQKLYILRKTFNYNTTKTITYPKGTFGETDEEAEAVAVGILKFVFEDLLEWDVEACRNGITQEIIDTFDLQKTINRLPKIAEFNGHINSEYIAHLMYPDKVPFRIEEVILEIYHDVLSGRTKFPDNFFTNEETGERNSRICLANALKNGSFISLEHIFYTLSDRNKTFLKDNKLEVAATNFQTPIDYLWVSLNENLRGSASEKADFLFNQYKFEYLYKLNY